jgi:subtilase family serine protease
MLVIILVLVINFGIPGKSGFQGSLYLSRESLGNWIFPLFQKTKPIMAF